MGRASTCKPILYKLAMAISRSLLIIAFAASAVAFPAKPDVVDDVNKLAASSAGLATQTSDVADAVTKQLQEMQGNVKTKESELQKAKTESESALKTLNEEVNKKNKDAAEAIGNAKSEKKAKKAAADGEAAAAAAAKKGSDDIAKAK